MKIYFLVIFLFLTFSVKAQKFRIQGKLQDGQNNTIAYASIGLLKSGAKEIINSQFADSLGFFAFHNLKDSLYSLQVSCLGYKDTLILNIKPIDDNIQKYFSFILKPNSVSLKGISVKASKIPLTIDHQKITLNISENNLFYKNAKDVFDILTKAPGIQVNSTGSILVNKKINPVIFINGKDVLIDAENASNYLKGISSNIIEKIEIINNPSAMYNADYKAIINIVLKKDENLGFTMRTSSQINNNSLTGINQNFSFNYTQKKMISQGFFSFINYPYIKNFSFERNSKTLENLRSDTELLGRGKNLSYYLDYTYIISKKSQIGAFFKGFVDDSQSETMVTSSKGFLQPNFNINTEVKKNSFFKNNSLSLFYELKNQKSKFIWNSLFSKFGTYENQDIFENSSSEILYLNTKNGVDILSSQADYSYIIDKKTFQTGLKFSNTKSNNTLNSNEPLNSFLSFSIMPNDFRFYENISSFYSDFSNNTDKYTYSLGFRIEKTDNLNHQIDKNIKIRKDYLNFFPNISFSYIIKEQKTLNFSFNNSISRPGYFSLNPNIFYLSPFSYLQGNPNLQPAITKKISVNYSQNNSFLIFSIGRELNQINQLPFLEANTIKYLNINYPKNDFVSLELTKSFEIKKWLNLNYNTGFYYNNSHINYDNRNYSLGVPSFYFQGSHTVSLPKKMALEINGWYQTGTSDAIIRIFPRYEINTSFYKPIFKSKGSLRLNIYDIFYSNIRKYAYRNSDVEGNVDIYKYGTRRAVLQINYAIGNNLKNLNKKNISSEENRVY